MNTTGGNCMANAADAVIHCYPDSPYIAKAQVDFRQGGHTAMSVVMRDAQACREYLGRCGWSVMSVREIIH